MKIVALLDSMWGWRGFNEAGEDAPRYFRINPDNHSGRRLYRLVGTRSLLVTNCCRVVQPHANSHGKPDPKWVIENLTFLRKEGMGLLLVCGKVAQETFSIGTGFKEIGGIYPFPSGEVSLPGMGSDKFDYLCIDHPAARRWSNEKLNAVALEIDQKCLDKS